MRLAFALAASGICIATYACGSFSEANDVPSNGDASTTPADDAGAIPDVGPPNDGAVIDAGTTDAADITTGLIAYWTLDEGNGTSVADSVGNNDGMITGGGYWTQGMKGAGFATNGDGSVSVPWHPSLVVTNAFTLALWVNLDSAPSDSWIYAHGYQFYLKLNGRKPQLGVVGYYKVLYDLPLNEWHHLAATFESGVAKIYVDGFEAPADDDTLVPDSGPIPNSDGVLIGSAVGFENFAVGKIDDVRVYGRVLSAQEIGVLAK
jgi:uncharacterized protein